MTPFLQTLALGSGLLTAYVAACLYETEDGHLQSAVEDWWVRIDDWAIRVDRHQHNILIHLLRAVSKFLDAVFGPRLVSFRAACASLGLTMGWVAASGSLVGVFGHLRGIEWVGPNIILWMAGVTGVSLLSAILSRPLLRTDAQKAAANRVLAFGIAAYVLQEVAVVLLGAPVGRAAVVFGALLCSVGADFVFIAITRRLFRRVQASRIAPVLLLFAGVLLTGIVLTSAPAGLALYCDDMARAANPYVPYYVPTYTVQFLGTFASGNTHIYFIAVLLSFMAGVLVVDHGLLRLLSRITYQPARHRMFGNKTILWAVAIALITIAVPAFRNSVMGMLTSVFAGG